MKLAQWFLTGGVHVSPGGHESLRALYNMESFWTGKCSVQFAYRKSGGLETKDYCIWGTW